MKRLILIASLMLASTMAFAGNVHSDGRGGYYNNHGESCDSHGNVKPPKNNGGGNGGNGGNGGAGGNSSSSATGGNASASQTQQQGQTQTAVADATAAASVSGVGNGSNNVNINTPAPKIPVATAYAASLTSGMDTCLGSVAGGVQTQILGLSGGGTKVDKNCVLIKQVQLLQQLGYSEAACRRARMGEEGKAIDEAMTAAGVDCKPVPVVVVPADVVTHEELNNVAKKALQK